MSPNQKTEYTRKLQPIASPSYTFLHQPPSGMPEGKMPLAKCVPGAVSTSTTLLQNVLSARFIFPSKISTDVTTPSTRPQNTFDRNMDVLINLRNELDGNQLGRFRTKTKAGS